MKLIFADLFGASKMGWSRAAQRRRNHQLQDGTRIGLIKRIFGIRNDKGPLRRSINVVSGNGRPYGRLPPKSRHALERQSR
jgi:hypothetical protein